MSVTLQIELWAAKKAKQKFKLRFTSMGKSVALIVHDHERCARRVAFNNIIEGFH